MYKLKRLNVVRTVSDDSGKEKLMSEGFELIENEKSERGENPPNGEGGINYSEMTVPDLQALCKEKGLSGYSNFAKEDLIKFISEKLTTEGKN